MTKTQEKDEKSTSWADLFFDLWGPMKQFWEGGFPADTAQPKPESKGRASDSMQANVRMWQTVFGAMMEPEALETIQKTFQMAPDLAWGITQSHLKCLGTFQEKSGKWMEKREGAKDPLDIQALDKELIHQWNVAYEEELSRYLKIPQIGLTRYYQERAMNAADKFNVFQGSLVEFMYMLYLPMEKAFQGLQEKLAEQAEEGALDQKLKTYYHLWIKILESHYMELFKDPEFIEGMSHTLEALEECSDSRQAVINDFLKICAIPTHNEMDDLYKEIYLLKKRMRSFEKEKIGLVVQ